MVFLNPHEISFPDPATTESDSGLMAIGGDLSPERLLFAYETGFFPWFNEGEEILWWCPDPRFVLFPKNLKISKSMKKVLKDKVFTFTENECFVKVMQECQKTFRTNQDGTWISDAFIDSYSQLHQKGYAKSIEVWKDGELAGGFYGVQIGNVFCGESMFTKVSNASKAGFIDFVSRQKNVLALVDCQIHSEHLESLGAEMIPKREYLEILKNNNER